MQWYAAPLPPWSASTPPALAAYVHQPRQGKGSAPLHHTGTPCRARPRRPELAGRETGRRVGRVCSPRPPTTIVACPLHPFKPLSRPPVPTVHTPHPSPQHRTSAPHHVGPFGTIAHRSPRSPCTPTIILDLGPFVGPFGNPEFPLPLLPLHPIWDRSPPLLTRFCTPYRKHVYTHQDSHVVVDRIVLIVLMVPNTPDLKPSLTFTTPLKRSHTPPLQSEQSQPRITPSPQPTCASG